MNIKITFYKNLNQKQQKRPKIIKKVKSFHTALSLFYDDITILKNNKLYHYSNVKDIEAFDDEN